MLLQFSLFLLLVVAQSRSPPSAESSPTVQFVYPQERSLSHNTPIQVVYSRPVIALGQDYTSQDEVPKPFRFADCDDPSTAVAVNGGYRWVTTNILRFDPDGPWPNDLCFLLVSDPTVTTYDGAQIEMPEADPPHRFTTRNMNAYVQGIRSLAFPWWYSSSECPPDAVLAIRFSVPVDLDLIKDRVRIAPQQPSRLESPSLSFIGPCRLGGWSPSPIASRTPAVSNCVEFNVTNLHHPFKDTDEDVYRYQVYIPEGTMYSANHGPLRRRSGFDIEGLSRLRFNFGHVMRQRPAHRRYKLVPTHPLHLNTSLHALEQAIAIQPALPFTLAWGDSANSSIILSVDVSPDMQVELNVDPARTKSPIRDVFGLPLVPTATKFQTASAPVFLTSPSYPMGIGILQLNQTEMDPTNPRLLPVLASETAKGVEGAELCVHVDLNTSPPLVAELLGRLFGRRSKNSNEDREWFQNNFPDAQNVPFTSRLRGEPSGCTVPPHDGSRPLPVVFQRLFLKQSTHNAQSRQTMNAISFASGHVASAATSGSVLLWVTKADGTPDANARAMLYQPLPHNEGFQVVQLPDPKRRALDQPLAGGLDNPRTTENVAMADEHGLIVVPVSRDLFGQIIPLVESSSGVLVAPPLRVYRSMDPHTNTCEVRMLASRTLVKPGDDVHVKVYVRMLAGGRLVTPLSPDFEAGMLSLRAGRSFVETAVDVDKRYGTGSAVLTLPTDIAQRDISVEFKQGHACASMLSLTVADPRIPVATLNAKASAPHFSTSQATYPVIAVDVNTYTGTPIPGAKLAVSWTIAGRGGGRKMPRRMYKEAIGHDQSVFTVSRVGLAELPRLLQPTATHPSPFELFRSSSSPNDQPQEDEACPTAGTLGDVDWVTDENGRVQIPVDSIRDILSDPWCAGVLNVADVLHQSLQVAIELHGPTGETLQQTVNLSIFPTSTMRLDTVSRALPGVPFAVNVQNIYRARAENEPCCANKKKLACLACAEGMEPAEWCQQTKHIGVKQEVCADVLTTKIQLYEYRVPSEEASRAFQEHVLRVREPSVEDIEALLQLEKIQGDSSHCNVSQDPVKGASPYSCTLRVPRRVELTRFMVLASAHDGYGGQALGMVALGDSDVKLPVDSMQSLLQPVLVQANHHQRNMYLSEIEQTPFAYRRGDTVSIALVSPFPSATVLVLWGTRGNLHSKIFSLTVSGPTVVSFTMDEDASCTVHVMVKPVMEGVVDSDDGIGGLNTAEFFDMDMLGYRMLATEIQVPVDTSRASSVEASTLVVQVAPTSQGHGKTAKETSTEGFTGTPGSTMDFSVDVFESGAQPKSGLELGEVAVFVVDQALLDLKPNPLPSPETVTSSRQITFTDNMYSFADTGAHTVKLATLSALIERFKERFAMDPFVCPVLSFPPTYNSANQLLMENCAMWLESSMDDAAFLRSAQSQLTIGGQMAGSIGGRGGGFGDLAMDGGMRLENTSFNPRAANPTMMRAKRGGVASMQASAVMESAQVMADEGDSFAGGGGGAQADATQATLDPRSEFESVPLFVGFQKLDEHGHTSFTLKLPDNIGAFNLRVVASQGGGDFRFGSLESSVVVQKPMSLVESAPRIARSGDYFECGVVATVEEPAFRGTIEVTAEIVGGDAVDAVAELDGKSKLVVEVSGPARPYDVRFKFHGKSSMAGELRVVFHARLLRKKKLVDEDSLQVVVPVEPLQQVVDVATSVAFDLAPNPQTWIEGLSLPPAYNGTLTVEAGFGYLTTQLRGIRWFLDESKRSSKFWWRVMNAMGGIVSSFLCRSYGVDTLEVGGIPATHVDALSTRSFQVLFPKGTLRFSGIYTQLATFGGRSYESIDLMAHAAVFIALASRRDPGMFTSHNALRGATKSLLDQVANKLAHLVKQCANRQRRENGVRGCFHENHPSVLLVARNDVLDRLVQNLKLDDEGDETCALDCVCNRVLRVYITTSTDGAVSNWELASAEYYTLVDYLVIQGATAYVTAHRETTRAADLVTNAKALMALALLEEWNQNVGGSLHKMAAKLAVWVSSTVLGGREGAWISPMARMYSMFALELYDTMAGNKDGYGSVSVRSGRHVVFGRYLDGTKRAFATESKQWREITDVAGKQPLPLLFRYQGKSGDMVVTSRASFIPAYLPPSSGIFRGIYVEKLIQRFDPKTNRATGEMVRSVVPGEYVQVTIQIRVVDSLADVRVVDLIVAGLEPVDPRIHHEPGTGRTVMSFCRSFYSCRFLFQDTRKDRVVWESSRLSPGTYTLVYFAKAVTSGFFWIPPTVAMVVEHPEIMGASGAEESHIIVEDIGRQTYYTTLAERGGPPTNGLAVEGGHDTAGDANTMPCGLGCEKVNAICLIRHGKCGCPNGDLITPEYQVCRNSLEAYEVPSQAVSGYPVLRTFMKVAQMGRKPLQDPYVVWQIQRALARVFKTGDKYEIAPDDVKLGFADDPNEGVWDIEASVVLWAWDMVAGDANGEAFLHRMGQFLDKSKITEALRNVQGLPSDVHVTELSLSKERVEKPAVAQKGGACGGDLGITCAAGLACQWSHSTGNVWYGTCVERIVSLNNAEEAALFSSMHLVLFVIVGTIGSAVAVFVVLLQPKRHVFSKLYGGGSANQAGKRRRSIEPPPGDYQPVAVTEPTVSLRRKVGSLEPE